MVSQRLDKVKVEVCELQMEIAEDGIKLDPTFRNSTAIRVGHHVCIPCTAYFEMLKVSSMVTVDVTTNVMQCKAVKGPVLCSGQAILYGDTFLWLGMANAEGEQTAVMDLSTYDLVMKEWSTFPVTGQSPCIRYACSWEFVAARNRFIVFGGLSQLDKWLNDVHLLDADRQRWIKPIVKGKPPSTRAYNGFCVRYSTFYCYGGVNQGSYTDGMFLLQLSASDIVTWSKPEVNFVQMSSLRLSSFAFVPFEEGLLICGGNGIGNEGLRMYDPKTDLMIDLKPKEPKSFRGYGYAISAVPLEYDSVVGVFGTHGSSMSYIRISIED